MPSTLGRRQALNAMMRVASRKRLARQQADFTAEGAPPPGRVATEAPATPEPGPVPKPADGG